MQTWLLKTEEGIELGGKELFDTWKATPGSLLWLDIEGGQDESVRALLEKRFGQDTADVEDDHRERQPPTNGG